MSFSQILISSIKGMFPGFLIWAVLPMIPFIIAEQRWPVGIAPGLRDYGMNILISVSTAFLSLPLGIAAGLWSSHCATCSFGNRSPSASTALALSQLWGLDWKS